MEYVETTNAMGASIATITIHPLDFLGVDLDNNDKAIMKECNESDLIADKLLGLELIARKIQAKAIKETK